MTNNAQLLPLPELSDDDLELLHYNPNTSDVVEFLHRYAQSYALACIEAAKPADALGSLPVVAYFMKFADGSEEYSRYLPSQADYEDIPHHITKLTDHAKASAEIAQRDAEIERLKYQLGGGELAAQELERQVDYLRAKLAGVDGLVEALRAIIDNGPFTASHKELLDAGSAALATYGAAQGEKE